MNTQISHVMQQKNCTFSMWTVFCAVCLQVSDSLMNLCVI